MKQHWLFYIGRKRMKFGQKTPFTEVFIFYIHKRIFHLSFFAMLMLFVFPAKEPSVPLRIAYCNATEFATLSELENISTDVDAMRTQSLLICERVLGIQHTDTLFRLMFRYEYVCCCLFLKKIHLSLSLYFIFETRKFSIRNEIKKMYQLFHFNISSGASYADSLRFQRCIDLWRLALQVRIKTHSILHSDTCFTTQALVRLMLDLENKSDEGESFIGSDVPKFEDVYGVFTVLHKNLIDARKLLQIRPVYRKQQENFDRVLKCVTHLIYLLEVTSKTVEEKQFVNKILLCEFYSYRIL